MIIREVACARMPSGDCGRPMAVRARLARSDLQVLRRSKKARRLVVNPRTFESPIQIFSLT